MNDFLNVHVLCPDQHLSGMPIPLQYDETDYSYITRVMLLTAATDQARIVEHFFRSKCYQIERPVHSGFGHFTQHFGKDDCGDMVDEHSMFALFKPFADPERYQHARRLVMGSKCNGVSELIGLRKEEMFRDHPAICLDCVKEDVKHENFSYYRRSQQVSAVSHCAIHQTPLVSECLSCGSSFSHWNLPSQHCHYCGEQLIPVEYDQESLPDVAARARLSKVIAALFSGEIHAVDVNLRIAVLQNRTQQVIRNRSGLVGDNLATHINKIFGRCFLAKLGLETHVDRKFGWPTLLLQGRLLVHDPIATSVLIAALFDSVDQYKNAIGMQKGLLNTLRKKAEKPITTVPISYIILKDILRTDSVKEVALRHHINYWQLKKWIASYPGLCERRAKSIFTRKLRHYKKAIQNMVTDELGITRNKLSMTLGTEIAFIRRYDLQWLDQHLPAQKNSNVLQFQKY